MKIDKQKALDSIKDLKASTVDIDALGHPYHFGYMDAIRHAYRAINELK